MEFFIVHRGQINK